MRWFDIEHPGEQICYYTSNTSSVMERMVPIPTSYVTPLLYRVEKPSTSYEHWWNVWVVSTIYFAGYTMTQPASEEV